MKPSFRPSLPRTYSLNRALGYRISGWYGNIPTKFKLPGAQIPENFDQLPLHLQLLAGVISDSFRLGLVPSQWIQQNLAALSRQPPFAQAYNLLGELGWLSPFGVGPSYILGMINTVYRAGWLGLNLGDTYQYEAFVREQLGLAEQMRHPETILAHLARAGYGQAQQDLAVDVFGMNVIKLGSYFNTRLTPVRALSFPFMASYRAIASTAAMATELSLLYHINPSYTQSLIQQSGYFNALNYQSTIPSLISGVGEWTGAQLGIWGIKSGFKETLKASVGLSLVQPGLQLGVEMLTTVALRSLLGMPAFFNNEEEQAYRMQMAIGGFLTGIGVSIMAVQALGGLGGPISFARAISPPLPSISSIYGPISGEYLGPATQMFYEPLNIQQVTFEDQYGLAQVRLRGTTGRFISIEQVQNMSDIYSGVSTMAGFLGFIAGGVISDYLYETYAAPYLTAQGLNQTQVALGRVGVDITGAALLGTVSEKAAQYAMRSEAAALTGFAQGMVGRVAATALGIASGVLEAYFVSEAVKMGLESFNKLQNIAASTQAVEEVLAGNLTITTPPTVQGFYEGTAYQMEDVGWLGKSLLWGKITLPTFGAAAPQPGVLPREPNQFTFTIPYSVGLVAVKKQQIISNPLEMRAINLYRIQQAWAPLDPSFRTATSQARTALSVLNMAMEGLFTEQAALSQAYTSLQKTMNSSPSDVQSQQAFQDFYTVYSNYMAYRLTAITEQSKYQQLAGFAGTLIRGFTSGLTPEQQALFREWFAPKPAFGSGLSKYLIPDVGYPKKVEIPWRGDPHHPAIADYMTLLREWKTVTGTVEGLYDKMDATAFRTLYAGTGAATRVPTGQDYSAEYFGFIAGEVALAGITAQVQAGTVFADPDVAYTNAYTPLNRILSRYSSGGLNAGQTLSSLRVLGYNAYITSDKLFIIFPNGDVISVLDLAPTSKPVQGSGWLDPQLKQGTYVSGWSGHGYYWNWNPTTQTWNYNSSGDYDVERLDLKNPKYYEGDGEYQW